LPFVGIPGIDHYSLIAVSPPFNNACNPVL
jgi:hypothetical protein